MARLSENFDSREFRMRDGRGLPTWYREQLPTLVTRYLQPLRNKFGPVTVHSGWRSDTHNQQVGGAPGSYHLNRIGRRGVGADVSAARGTPRDWYRFLEQLDPGGLGLYKTHVHVDTRPGRARW